MKDIFGLSGIGTYEQRKVANYKAGPLVIDTVFASDTGLYETAVAHPDYNEGKWVIVEEYATRPLATAGHKKWIQKMSKSRLPDELIDVSGAFLAGMCDTFSGENEWRRMKRIPK